MSLLCRPFRLARTVFKLSPSSQLTKGPSSARVHRHTTALHHLHTTTKTMANNKDDPKEAVSDMQDEYGTMDSSGHTYIAKNFLLESGQTLKEAHARYNTFGTLNATKDNVIIVCHALTGNSRLDQWWGSMLGPGRPFDTSKYLVVCANVLGSCYGSSGPQSIDPDTGKPYGNTFPDCSIRDTVRLHMMMAKESIGAVGIFSVIGGSMGGMQALEWALLGEHYVKSAVSIGCGAAHTAWQIAMSETQRQAIYADPKWNNGDVNMADPPTSGLSVARQMAMISYRNAKAYHGKFGRDMANDGQNGSIFQAKKYLIYQGTKFIERFDPVTYVKITEQMDRHDVGHLRGGVMTALNSIKCRYMVMGIDTDLLYPLHEQEELASGIPNCDYHVIKSPDGHDGFLLEQDQVGSHIAHFLSTIESSSSSPSPPPLSSSSSSTSASSSSESNRSRI